MSRPFRFAIQATNLTDPEVVRTLARQAESLGYAELYSSDHIGTAVGRNSVDPFVPLIVAAEATTTLRVGPLVINNEFHQPALLARMAITVDQMTSGRLVLGLGTGYAQVEHDAIGMPLHPPGPRVTRFAESLHVLRALCDHGHCTFNGDHHHIVMDDMGIAPVQSRIPFLIGGHGPRVVALAAAHCDIFQFTGLTHADDGTPSGGGFAYEHIAERAAWLTDAAGDRSSDIERSALVQFTAVDRALTSQDRDRLAAYTDIVDATPFMFVGSVEQVVDKLERTREQLGISHIVVRDPEDFAPVVAALAGR